MRASGVVPRADLGAPVVGDDGSSPGGPAASVSSAVLRTSHTRRALAVGVIVAVLVVVVIASLVVGAKPIPLSTVWRALTSFDGSPDHLVVRKLRVPRTALGVVSGAALGVAGALMQAITRNPLADPGLLGVNAGASLAVVSGIAVFGLTTLSAYVWLAFAGALVAAVVVYGLGSLGRGGATPVRLALAGVALAALLSSFTSAIVLLDRKTLDQYRFWVVGSVAGRNLTVLVHVVPFVVVGLVIAFAVARPLNAVGLGEETARALGVRVGATRAATAAAVALLCGAATAACGPIGFVGLVVPLAARVVVGPDQRWLVPFSALCGPAVLVGCDTAGRVLARPAEVQVGIVTAAIGGPLFVILVRRVRVAQL